MKIKPLKTEGSGPLTKEDEAERRTGKPAYSENHFRSLFHEHSAVFLLIEPGTGEIVDANRSASNFYGYSAAELKGKNIREINVLPSNEVVSSMRKALDQGVNCFIFPHRLKTGEIRTVEVYSTPIVIDGQTLLFSIVHDISERRLAEEGLHIERERLAGIIEGTNVGTWEWNVQTGEAVFNDRWAEIVGYRLEELTPVSIATWTELAHPDDLDISNKLLEKHFNGEIEYYKCESRMKHKDGRWVWVLDKGKVARWSEDGKPLLMLGTHQDITDRKLTEEELRQARQTAESANRAKGEFLANMSHEIRTPLHGVLGMAQLLERTGLTREQRTYVDNLKLSGENLLSLVNSVLDLSKIEAGKIMVEPVWFSLGRCISEVVSTQQALISSKSISLEVYMAEEIPHLMYGDQLRIRQILLNLLGNAVKFTTQGGITISAQLIEQYGDSILVELAVRDSGIGISADVIDNIFNPFVQEDGSTTRTFGGTGLGLAITRQLTELLSGSITVESTQGIGSCFKIRLPFTTAATAQESRDAADPLTMISWNGPALRILLADDNTICTLYGRVMLEKLGHETVCVVNGKECLNALKHASFDLVLMDIQMPVMNGEDALREIRKSEQGNKRHLPIIAMTAHALQGDRERFLADGFDGYLSKPIMVKDLINEMHRAFSLNDGTASEDIWKHLPVS